MGVVPVNPVNALLSTAFVLCWSSGFIGAKLGAGSAPAVTVLMWRFLPLAVILIAVAAVVGRASWRGLTARDVARQAVIGVLSQSGYLLTVYYAIQLGVSSGTTALIDGVQPLVAGALAGPLLHPDQPTAVVNSPSPPGWWHAAGERYARQWPAGRPVS